METFSVVEPWSDAARMVSWQIGWYTGCSDGRSLLCSFTTSLRIACGVVGKDVGY